MSLFGIGSASTVTPTALAQMSSVSAPRTVSLPYGAQTVYAGGLTAQPGNGSSILKRMLVGGGLGAALGFGASFFTLPVIGQVAAPIAAAVGGGIGAVAGLVSGLWSRRKARLAMQRSSMVAPGAGALPITVKPGKTMMAGEIGPDVRWTQRQLKRMGLYSGKINGRMDSRTVTAIRKYEIMKGAVPTGTTSPELRSVLAQDARYAAKYA